MNYNIYDTYIYDKQIYDKVSLSPYQVSSF